MKADLQYIEKSTTLPPKAGSKRGRRVLEKPKPQSPSTLKKRDISKAIDRLRFEIRKVIFDTLEVGKKFDTWLGECIAIRDSKTIAGSNAYNFYNEEIHIYVCVINIITYAKDFFDI